MKLKAVKPTPQMNSKKMLMYNRGAMRHCRRNKYRRVIAREAKAIPRRTGQASYKSYM